MKVLIVTNIYPSENHPYHGVFVAEQIQSIKRLFQDVLFDVYYINGFGGKWNYIKSIWEVRRRINQNNYDLVHIHYGFAGLFLFCPFLKKTKIITTFHGSDIQPKGGNGYISVAVSRHTAKCSDAAIVLNDSMDEMVLPYCSKTFMIPCAVDVNTFTSKNSESQRLKPRIVFPSNPSRQVKNYPLFRKTIDVLNQQFGVDAEEVQLVDMTRNQIADLFNNSDVLLMTSNSEGSPQVIKEAMACNLPCVSTPVGDVKDLLAGVKDCYVSEKHDANELAKLVVRALKKEGDGVSGRDKILKLQLDEESIARRVYSLYSQVISH